MIGNLDPKDKKVSLYQPPKEVADLTKKVKDDYILGYNNLNEPYRELNDLSPIQRADKDQKVFNNYRPPKSLDPDQAWRYDGIRPLTRNAVMVMAAQMTARILFPNVSAQNDKDESDKMWGNIMRDLILYHIENSNYEKSFVFGVISALVNPATFFKVEFVEAVQIIRTRLATGEIDIKEAVDEVFSGLDISNIPLTEMFIANPYGGINIQKQRFIIRRRFIEHSEAEGIYVEHDNWGFVQPDIRVFFNEEDGTFYENKDDDNRGLVEEVIYYNRQEDMEIPFVNGIYMGDSDVEANLFSHRTNRNKPRYPFAHFGYHPIDEGNFFYFKSLVFSMENEQEFATIIQRMVIDGTFLSLMPPIGISGDFDGEFDASVIFPGATTFLPEDAKISPISVGSDLNAGYRALQEAEATARESSAPEVIGGNLPDATQKAFNVARAETNARIKMSVFGKMIGWAVEQVGDLMVDIILTHQTTAEVGEIVGGVMKMKYKSFIVNEQSEDGKKVNKKIIFTEDLLGVMRNKKDNLKRSFEMMKKEGGLDADTRLINVNPNAFRKLSFKIRIDADALLPRSEEVEKELNLVAWQNMIQSPFANREAVDRDFLFENFAEGESSKYMIDQPIEQILGAQQNEGRELLETRRRENVGQTLPA